MKTPPPVLKVIFLLFAVLVVSPCFAADARTQTASPPTPALTAEQQKYVKVRDMCVHQFQEQKLPRSQIHTFLRECYKENGITKAVAFPEPEQPKPPAPLGSVKTNK